MLYFYSLSLEIHKIIVYNVSDNKMTTKNLIAQPKGIIQITQILYNKKTLADTLGITAWGASGNKTIKPRKPHKYAVFEESKR